MAAEESRALCDRLKAYTARLEVAHFSEVPDGKIQRSTEYVVLVPPEAR